MKLKIAVDYVRVKYTDSNIPVVNTVALNLPISEQFSSNNNGWPDENLDKYSSAVKGGKLEVERKKEGGILISKEINIDTNKDFIIETSLSRQKEGASGIYGVTFGRKNGSNEYTFLLSTSGSYGYRKFENDKYTSIIPFTSNSNIKTGVNEYNKVKIVKSGSLLRFYINDVYVNESPFEGFFGNKFGYTAYFEQKIAVDYLNIKYQTSTYNYPPLLVITEPDVNLKRGFNIVKSKRITVKGKATDKDGIYEVLINGVDANVLEDGTFTANVPLAIGSNELVVKATDIKQMSSTKTFTLKRTSPNPVTPIVKKDDIKLDLGFGEYYALLIGVSDYNHDEIPDLAGAPINDDRSLADVLKDNYNFKEENVFMLTNNPKRNEILEALFELRKKVTDKDNVIIFYAGHGNFNAEENRGWWMPSDYIPGFEGNKIGNDEIKEQIRLIDSKHTLLISDACFTGGVFKETRSGKVAPKSVKVKYNLKSRNAMTSGNLKEVPNKSIFLKYLVQRLEENQNKYLPANRLFLSLEDAVINNTENTPRYGTVFGVGDEGGDFIFIRIE